MARHCLQIFMVFTVFANLVLAADWHPTVGEGGAEPVFEVHQSHDHSVSRSMNASGELAGHQDSAESGCCFQHACHAHSHLFSVNSPGFLRVPLGVGGWLAEPLPLPPARFLTPDVPPPIA